LLLILSNVIAVAIYFIQQRADNTSQINLVDVSEAQPPGSHTCASPITAAPTPTPEQDLAEYNAGTGAYDTHVRFWGRVLDQNSDPVEGATIKASVTTLRMIKVEGGYREFTILTAQSAADGTFMLDGADGFSLSIRQLSKDGYVLPSAYQAGTRWGGATYFYCYKSIDGMEIAFRPDPSRPMIFHLWKLKKPEPVAIIDMSRGGPEFKVGAPPTPELFTNMTVTDVGTAQAPQWEVTVSGIKSDDGVVKADPSDLFMFQAPASGYTHSIKFKYGMKGTDAIKGEEGAPVRFYVRSKGGRWYSAEECAFFAPKGDGTIIPKIRSWTNPNGSRNLEHDAAHPLPEPLLTE